MKTQSLVLRDTSWALDITLKLTKAVFNGLLKILQESHDPCFVQNKHLC